MSRRAVRKQRGRTPRAEPVPIVQRPVSFSAPRDHALCEPCYRAVEPHRTPRPAPLDCVYRPVEVCCRCNAETRDRIYYHGLEDQLACRGDHIGQMLEPVPDYLRDAPLRWRPLRWPGIRDPRRLLCAVFKREEYWVFDCTPWPRRRRGTPPPLPCSGEVIRAEVLVHGSCVVGYLWDWPERWSRPDYTPPPAPGTGAQLGLWAEGERA